MPHAPLIPVRIVVVPWLIPAWARAQTWRNVVLVRAGVELTPQLFAHELAHVLQWRSLGIAGFICRYARYLISYGYEKSPLEVAARLAAGNQVLLAWAQEILSGKD